MTLVSLQYLRGVAALMVVYHHVGFALTRISGTDLPLAPLGAAGVDIFFVLSGFIIWVTTWSKDLSPSDFLYRRATRIIPLYWGVTILVSVLMVNAPTLFNTVHFDAYNAAYSIVFIPAMNPSLNEIMPVYSLGWTINYEVFFYAIFACVITLPKRYWLILSLAVFVTVALAGAGSLARNNIPLVFWTRPIVLEFAFGVVAGWMYLRRLILPAPFAIGGLFVGIAALLLTQLWGISYPPNGASIWRVIEWGGPAFLIVLALPTLETRGYRFPLGVFSALGDASYSIYMTHLMVLPALAIVWSRLGLGFSGVMTPAFVCFSLVAACTAGWVCFKVWEQPFMRLSHRWRAARPGVYKPEHDGVR